MTVASGVIVRDPGAVDFAVALGAGELRPGLINAHDHLHRNHYPRLGEPPYRDAYEWGRDLHERWSDEIASASAVPRRDALLFGALKNLLAGATTAVHHDPWEPEFERDFPIRVPRIRTVHSLGTEPDALDPSSGGEEPWCIHLAEGVGEAAAEEVRELDATGALNPGMIAVHLIGVDADGVRRLTAARAAMVWCPTSNQFLFGRTAPTDLLTSGVDVLLGSDSLLTADGTLLDELRFADGLNVLDPATLIGGVGAVAASRLGLPAPTLDVGAPADLVCLRRPILEATGCDVALVVVGGVPRLGDPRFGELFERCGVVYEELALGGATKLVARPLATVASRLVDTVPEAGRILELGTAETA